MHGTMDSMRTMGEITCQLSENAIKPGLLYCSEPEAYRFEEWSLGYGWVTAIGTVALAIFAIAAWMTSRHTLRMMREQIDEQRTATENAIKADRQLAMDGRQELLLAEYCTDLLRLGNVAGNTDIDLTAFTSATTTAWMNWGMHMFRIDDEFRTLTGEWNMHFNSECRVLAELIAFETDYPSGLDLQANVDSFRTIIGSYIGHIQIWQTDPDRRAEIHTKFMDIRNPTIFPSPAVDVE